MAITNNFITTNGEMPPYFFSSLVIPYVSYPNTPLWTEISLKAQWTQYADKLMIVQYEYEAGKYEGFVIAHFIANGTPGDITPSIRIYGTNDDVGVSTSISAQGYTAGSWGTIYYLRDKNNLSNTRIVKDSPQYYYLGVNRNILSIDDAGGIEFDNAGFTFESIAIDLEAYEYTWNGVLPDQPGDYEYGDTSGPDGGVGGTFDNASDNVDFAPLPSGGAAASGLISMFAPTAAQLADFGNFLWANLFDATYDSYLTSLKKWVNDPIESVIQLAAYPVTPPAGSAQVLKFCGIRSDLIGAGVSMNKCTSQFMNFDFGTLTVPAYWKQALDYSPYTQVSIYLPYIGICPLKSDDIIDASLQLMYHIDLLTGGFSAELKCSKSINGTSLASVLYNWSGNMATQIPITSSNFSQVFGSMMTAIAAIGVGAVSGGLGAAAGGAAAEGASVGAGRAMLSGAGQGLAANIGNVINSKPHVTQSGRLDGTVGALSQFTPYLIIERPVQSLSSKFQTEQGYPSNTVQTLKNLTGMTVCEAPVMDGFSGVNDDELNEIKSILCSGVIL